MLTNSPKPTSNAAIVDSRVFNERAFFPRPDRSAPPPGAEDHAVQVPGASLHMRVYRVPEARAAVLLFHGNGEVVRDYDAVARIFAASGAELAVVDFRGYGASTGTPTLRNSIEDSIAAFGQFQSLCRGKSLFVMGRSLGSACAAHLFSTLPEGAVAGVIIESGFSSLSRLIQRRGLSPVAGSAKDAFFDPIEKYSRGTFPLLIVHGESDHIIESKEAEDALRAAGSKEKRLVIVKGRDHNDVSEGSEYWPAIDGFINAR